MQDNTKHLYSKRGFHLIYDKKAKLPYMVYNDRLPFNNGHTHVKTYDQAQLLIDYSIAKKIPLEADDRLIESFIRICKDNKFKAILKTALENEQYRNEIAIELKSRARKKSNYYNRK